MIQCRQCHRFLNFTRKESPWAPQKLLHACMHDCGHISDLHFTCWCVHFSCISRRGHPFLHSTKKNSCLFTFMFCKFILNFNRSSFLVIRNSYLEYLHIWICHAVAGVYFAEIINGILSKNWKNFATQNYFDPNGVFLSALWSGPLLVISMIILVSFRYYLFLSCPWWTPHELFLFHLSVV